VLFLCPFFTVSTAGDGVVARGICAPPGERAHFRVITSEVVFGVNFLAISSKLYAARNN
jgi:hypothetical protein